MNESGGSTVMQIPRLCVVESNVPRGKDRDTFGFLIRLREIEVFGLESNSIIN